MSTTLRPPLTIEQIADPANRYAVLRRASRIRKRQGIKLPRGQRSTYADAVAIVTADAERSMPPLDPAVLRGLWYTRLRAEVPKAADPAQWHAVMDDLRGRCYFCQNTATGCVTDDGTRYVPICGGHGV
jgi:hypothetical protein